MMLGDADDNLYDRCIIEVGDNLFLAIEVNQNNHSIPREIHKLMDLHKDIFMGKRLGRERSLQSIIYTLVIKIHLEAPA